MLDFYSIEQAHDGRRAYSAASAATMKLVIDAKVHPDIIVNLELMDSVAKAETTAPSHTRGLLMTPADRIGKQSILAQPASSVRLLVRRMMTFSFHTLPQAKNVSRHRSEN